MMQYPMRFYADAPAVQELRRDVEPDNTEDNPETEDSFDKARKSILRSRKKDTEATSRKTHVA